MGNLINKYMKKEIEKLKETNKTLIAANTRLQQELSAIQQANYELNTNYKDMEIEYQNNYQTYITGIAEVNELKQKYETLILTMKKQKAEYELQMKTLLGI